MACPEGVPLGEAMPKQLIIYYMIKKNKKVAVAMSGGVDSSVAAALLNPRTL